MMEKGNNTHDLRKSQLWYADMGEILRNLKNKQSVQEVKSCISIHCENCEKCCTTQL